ncbi:MAG: hypothetical protein D3925_02390 [Candidatus Electrothrix sp. AR5]|nr:hypothetical protein [Candidatus Electrothrix sp. AR5]
MMDIFIVVFFEILFRGPAYLIVKFFTKSKPDENSFLAISVSILFWFSVGVVTYAIYKNFYSS